MNNKLALIWKQKNPFASLDKKFVSDLVAKVVKVKIMGDDVVFYYKEARTDKKYPVTVRRTETGENVELVLKDDHYFGKVTVDSQTIVKTVFDSGKSLTTSGGRVEEVEIFMSVSDLKDLVAGKDVTVVDIEF